MRNRLRTPLIASTGCGSLSFETLRFSNDSKSPDSRTAGASEDVFGSVIPSLIP